MMPLPKMATLVAVAGGCGIGLGTMMLLLNREREQFANQANFIVRAIEIMKMQPEVKNLLGDDIKVGQASMNDGWSRMTADNVQVKVPIKGEHDNAFLYAYAVRPYKKSRLRLQKIEATFGKIHDKKLVIFERSMDEILADDSEKADQVVVSSTVAAENKKKAPEEQVSSLPKTKEEMKEAMKSWEWNRER